MKGGGDGGLMILTNFFIKALFSLKRAISDGEDDEVLIEGYNEEIDTAKKNIMKLPERYGVGLTERGMRIYIDKITKRFHDVYSDELHEYPRVDNEFVNEFVKESINESSVAGVSKS